MQYKTLLQEELSSLRGHARFYKELTDYNFRRDVCGEDWLPSMTVVDRVVPTVMLYWRKPHPVVIKITFISIGLTACRRGCWPFTPPEIRLESGRIAPALQSCMDGNRIFILHPDWSPALQLSQIAMILGCWLNETIVAGHPTTPITKPLISHSRVDLRRRKSCPNFDTVTFADENARVIRSYDPDWNECGMDDMWIAYLEDVDQDYTRAHWHASTLAMSPKELLPYITK